MKHILKASVNNGRHKSCLVVLFISFRPSPVETFTRFQLFFYHMVEFSFLLFGSHCVFFLVSVCLFVQGYLKALGMARTAEVKRDARIGEAEARADSQIKEAIAEEERLAARLVNDIEIAKAQRDFELKKAAYDQEVQAIVRAFSFLYSMSNIHFKFRQKIMCSSGGPSLSEGKSLF